jgi:LacI family transcriptional regulator
VDKSRAYGRGVLRGIAEYVEAHGRWSLTLHPRASGRYSADWLRDWQGDGVLAFIEDAAVAAALRRARIPAIELFGHRLDLGLPHVGNDEEAIGRLAAEHLLARQFRHFAFAGLAGALWSARRQRGFTGRLHAAGLRPVDFAGADDDAASLAAWEANQRRLRAWLRALPRPTGLLAASDRLALRLLDACRAEGLAVPEQLAVIGVDDDEETCRLADPPLTSVRDDAPEVGRQAAALLDAWMSGRRVPADTRVFVPPAGVATRRSTEVTAVEDALVARACGLIRERACAGLTAAGLARELRVSRSLLYARFRRALGRRPHEEILRTRLGHAQALLRPGGPSVAEVAARCGFAHPEYLTVAFKRELGLTPGAFRRGQGVRVDLE